MSDLHVGQPAPDFKAIAIGGRYGAGEEVALADFRGSAIVLYFYPKDDTPGCTVQACSLREAWPDLSGKAEVFGVSTDSAMSHKKFIAKFDLPFPLLSDPEHTIVNAYGVRVEKSMYGRRYMGTERTTFVVDGKGAIAAILRKVKPEEHVALVTTALAGLAL